MARIVLQPNALELGLLREEYELVKRDLEEQGHDVEIREPTEFRRSVDPSAALITIEPGVAGSSPAAPVGENPPLSRELLFSRLAKRWATSARTPRGRLSFNLWAGLGGAEQRDGAGSAAPLPFAQSGCASKARG